MNVSKLFEATTIKGLTLPNRFVRSATWEGMANEDGSCTPELIELMVQLAHGGIGLIITGHTYVSPEGQAGPRQMGVYRDGLAAGLTDMTAAVHEAGGRIVMQLAHAGGLADRELTRREALGPSVMTQDAAPLNREMTREDIRQVVEAFGEGAARAERAGLDGVQIHAAHGYLLSEFLSPFYNKRTDAYGGSLENRARIVLEVLQSIKGRVGASFPVMIKLNAQDFVEGGLSADDAIKVASLIEASGIDAIELSGGTIHSGKLTPVRKGKLDSQDQEVYYRNEARRCKETLRAPLMLVGGIRSFEVAERLLDEGTTDYISLCRPLIREPGLINRWKSGDIRKATCESDNLCFKPAMAGEGLYCVVARKLRSREDRKPSEID
jgi:2,4-dienoyl-CoA reductase-like NADH-dependent reductase (Old Yellow Enzyme family)